MQLGILLRNQRDFSGASSLSYWRFSFEALSQDQRLFLESIPGFKLAGNSLAAPFNAAWLAAEILGAFGVEYAVTPPRSFTPRTAKAALPYLNEWVPSFLTPYQREGIQVVLSLPGESGHFWWSCGSGKSLGGLVWILARGPALSVVVTKAAIRGTWEREIQTYTRGVEWTVLEGMEGKSSALDRFRPAGQLTAPLILITGYDTLPAWISYLERLKPFSVVFDESQLIKSHKRWNAEVDVDQQTVEVAGEGIESLEVGVPIAAPKVSFSMKDNRTAAAYRLSRVARRRLATTATPIKDRVRDLWAQLDLIHPWQWGGYWTWAKRYCAASEGMFGGMDDKGKSNQEELKKRLSLVSHRVKYSEANRDLPPKRRLVTYIKVHEQCKPAGGITAELRNARRFGMDALREALLMEAAGRKRKVVLSRVKDSLDSKQKVVVFTGRRLDCERLRDDAMKWVSGGRETTGEFTSKIPGLEIYSGHGGDSAKARDEMKDRYMAASGPALLIGTIDAWGEGLNLQDTDLGVMAMLPYTPDKIIQGEGRWARLGQKRPVLIWYPICEGTIDEHVATILLNKLPAVEKMMDSDEIMGLGRELIGASEEELLASLCSKVLGEERA